MAHWQRIFPQNVITFFCRCKKEVSLERYIFADFVAYHFINLNWKLNSPCRGEGAATRRLVYIVPYGSYTTLAVRKGY